MYCNDVDLDFQVENQIQLCPLYPKFAFLDKSVVIVSHRNIYYFPPKMLFYCMANTIVSKGDDYARNIYNETCPDLLPK